VSPSSAPSNWAIVIGIDEYVVAELGQLTASVGDAERFYAWVVSESGGNVPPDQVRLLLGRRAGDDGQIEGERIPTKDNIVTAINEVLALSGDSSESLYFYFAGHGLTTRFANREESALVTPGFDKNHTDHSLAVRSLTEFFETTQFKDQFFFMDACRNRPWEREFEIGRWPIPRQRDPGAPPVQQFLLYATSPGRTAEEIGFPGESQGAFTRVLMDGLNGTGQAKAWSWERNCYEVRWERLANYVHATMQQRKDKRSRMERAGMQIPQDAGSRGVVDRDRDALLASFPRSRFPTLELTLEREDDRPFERVEISVLDAVGEPVVSAQRVTGKSVKFTLPPKTYAVRATTSAKHVFRPDSPIELYDDATTKLKQVPEGARAARSAAKGTIEVRSLDPLSVAEIRDEAGQPVTVTRAGVARLPPGFYRIRGVGPEPDDDETFIVLRGGRRKMVELKAQAPPAHVIALAKALGGSSRKGHVIPVAGAKPVAWAQPSTILAAGIGAALNRKTALEGLGLEAPQTLLGANENGIALYAVAGDGDPAALEGWLARAWRAGDVIPEETAALRRSVSGPAAAVGALVKPTEQAESHWVSFEREGEGELSTVVALPVLPGRLAVLVAQVDSDRIRLYQFHPSVVRAASSAPDTLRRVEHLQRLLLAGRLDGAQQLARELAAGASDDPFAGCLAGYVLLRLGLHNELKDVASAIVEIAPTLSDAYILRGEYEAVQGTQEARNQAFADAISAGIPVFGEGLTRLVEGLRASAFVHPRGALVRHIFQRHARGSMWAAFTPRRGLQPNQLVINGADLGFES